MRLLSIIVAATSLYAAEKSKSYTGVITDDMCGADHKMMGNTPSTKCVQDCVKEMKSKYALASGDKVYILSDQKTPEKFAGKEVTIVGALDASGKNLQVKSIAPAK